MTRSAPKNEEGLKIRPAVKQNSFGPFFQFSYDGILYYSEAALN